MRRWWESSVWMPHCQELLKPITKGSLQGLARFVAGACGGEIFIRASVNLCFQFDISCNGAQPVI